MLNSESINKMLYTLNSLYLKTQVYTTYIHATIINEKEDMDLKEINGRYLQEIRGRNYK